MGKYTYELIELNDDEFSLDSDEVFLDIMVEVSELSTYDTYDNLDEHVFLREGDAFFVRKTHKHLNNTESLSAYLKGIGIEPRYK